MCVTPACVTGAHRPSSKEADGRWRHRWNGKLIWRARGPDQISPIDDVLGWSLDDETRATIDRVLTEAITDPVGPEFMAPPALAEAGASLSSS